MMFCLFSSAWREAGDRHHKAKPTQWPSSVVPNINNISNGREPSYLVGAALCVISVFVGSDSLVDDGVIVVRLPTIADDPTPGFLVTAVWALRWHILDKNPHIVTLVSVVVCFCRC